MLFLKARDEALQIYGNPRLVRRSAPHADTARAMRLVDRVLEPRATAKTAQPSLRLISALRAAKAREATS